MFLSAAEDILGCKLVTFYSSVTCLYFTVLLSALYYTNYLYSVGKFSFYPVIGVIIIAECTKYSLGTFHVLKKQRLPGGKFEERYMNTPSKKSNIKYKIKEIVKCFVLMLFMTGVYFIIAILFGAQLFSNHEETFMLSAVLTALTIFPPCLNLGSSSVINLLFGMKSPGDAVWDSLLCILQCTLFGAWLGAFVIPLDWDRQWQAWPIPCATGAMVGYVVGNLAMLLSMLPKFVKKYYTKSGRKQR
ncbi:phosphatidylinositol-glycan biosynthesis class F protein [Anabrus simplex]|uniref:phosphatidylinositol-glycan biosynthesis class F protein n=1 Tax=Anabrus simplex TaxID=316456 RepID=UPI0034DD4EE0